MEHLEDLDGQKHILTSCYAKEIHWHVSVNLLLCCSLSDLHAGLSGVTIHSQDASTTINLQPFLGNKIVPRAVKPNWGQELKVGPSLPLETKASYAEKS